MIIDPIFGIQRGQKKKRNEKEKGGGGVSTVFLHSSWEIGNIYSNG
jgi:hypothetical protein